ncbi:MAG: iron ABC transporter permease [Armatimonadetes bacterium]|nr:iron ABC transporter permease [Armatimonadota bacterium]MDW8153116.1 iron ABC transporter permease [Armatimonadota bacterium]
MNGRTLVLPRPWTRVETATWVAVATGILVAFLTLYPTVMLFYGSVSDAPLGLAGHWTTAHYREAYTDPDTYRILANSLLFASGATAFSMLLATVLAWITVRTNAPGRHLFELIGLAPNVIPRFLVATSWSLVLSPRIGLLNRGVLQPLGLPPLNGYSLGGMMFVEGLVLTPLAFLILSAALRAMDPALEEAGRMAGSGVLDVTRRVTIPVMAPAVLGTATLNFARAIESLDIPVVLGMPVGIEVLSTKIFREALATLPPNHNLAATYAVGQLVMTLTLVGIYRKLTALSERYATITGRGYRPRVINLGPWRYLASGLALGILGLLVVVPLAVLVYVSLVPYYQVPTWEVLGQLTLRHYGFLLQSNRVARALQVSLTLALGGATVAMLLASLVAYFTVHRRMRLSGVLEGLSFVPWAFPGTALAVGLLWAYAQLPLPIYGTLWILLISYVTRFLPYGLRAMTSTMVQVHRELEESSRVCGAGFWGTFRKILLPLVRPGFLAGWAILFTIYIQEFSTSVLLYTPRAEPVGPLLFHLWEDGQVGDMAALGIVVSVLCVVVVAAARRWMREPTAP